MKLCLQPGNRLTPSRVAPGLHACGLFFLLLPCSISGCALPALFLLCYIAFGYCSAVSDMAVMGGEEKVVIEKYDAREEVSETSMVPESSAAKSQTLGSEDTFSVQKGEKKAKSFASLFQDNRNPAKGMTLHKVEFEDFTVDIEEEEVDDIIQAWGYALVGYVAGGFPGVDAITKMRNAWKIPHTFSLHKSGWLVFKFENEADRLKVLEGGPYMIFGRPLILKNMTPLFEFGACLASIIPTWILLPGLPIDLWNSKVLDKICSRVGVPLCTDRMTGLKERISYARVLVEVDIATELVAEVPIRLPGGIVRMQDIIYESLPKFCSHCRIMGHVLANCRKMEKEKRKDGTLNPEGQSDPSPPKSPTRGTSTRHKEHEVNATKGDQSGLTSHGGMAGNSAGGCQPTAKDVGTSATLPTAAVPPALKPKDSLPTVGTSKSVGQGQVQVANSFQVLMGQEDQENAKEIASPASIRKQGGHDEKPDPRKRITPTLISEVTKGKGKAKGRHGGGGHSAIAGGNVKGLPPKSIQ